MRLGSLGCRSVWTAFLAALQLALLSFATGCATDSVKLPNASWEPQRSPYGTIALAPETAPATFTFQKAKGKLGTVKEAFLDSAELGLSGPGAGIIVAGKVLSWDSDSWGVGPSDNVNCGYVLVAGAAAGGAGVVTAVGAALAGPVVGAKELIQSLKQVSPTELSEREAALTNALTQMAGQEVFHHVLVQSAADRIQGGFVSSAPGNSSEDIPPAEPDVILEAHVDDLRLERAGSTEGSYFLRIQTHARLVRPTDGAICFQERAEYCSGTALFLDWTWQGAVEGVAQTGYQALARYYIARILHGPSLAHN